MRIISIVLGLLLLAFISCTPKANNPAPKEKSTETTSLIKIAFGSCAHQDAPQPIWADITNEDADLWLWLGDNIYGDSDDMSIMQSKYDKQNASK